MWEKIKMVGNIEGGKIKGGENGRKVFAEGG